MQWVLGNEYPQKWHNCPLLGTLARQTGERTRGEIAADNLFLVDQCRTVEKPDNNKGKFKNSNNDENIRVLTSGHVEVSSEDQLISMPIPS